MIVDTEEVLREADGPVESGSNVRGEEPEDHKRHKFIPMPQASN